VKGKIFRDLHEMLHIGSDRSLFHDLREDSKNIRALHEIVKYKLCQKGCKLFDLKLHIKGPAANQSSSNTIR
jgi:hypothetical protein